MAIKHKRTSTANYTWQSTDLAEGQIGLNIADGTLHFKKSNNTVTKLSSEFTKAGACGTIFSSESGFTGTGLNNFFVGSQAGYCNTTGYNNNFFGRDAGRSNTTGYSNNFAGNCAGTSNTDGYHNNFFGQDAGRFNTSGNSNNFFGYRAGRANTTASDNNFFGKCSGYSNTTGVSNTFFGCMSGYTNTTGGNNIFFGCRSGIFNTTGSNNIFFGRCSGHANTTGVNNIFIGQESGSAVTTGANNVIIGSVTGAAGLCDTVILAAGACERLRVDSTGLSINGAPLTGAIGYTGSQGIQGDQGPIGYTGSAGAAGSIGPIGYTGSQGIQGIQGDQGPIGYTGSQGIAGTNGGTDIVLDTTPQLGGNLDVNSNSITSATNGNINITPDGTGKTIIKNMVYNESAYALSYSATITPDVANGTIQTVTLTGNVTFSAFSNPVAGQSMTLIIKQDATGSRTLTSTMKFAGGSKTLSTAANSVDILTVMYDGTNYWASLGKDFK